MEDEGDDDDYSTDEFEELQHFAHFQTRRNGVFATDEWIHESFRRVLNEYLNLREEHRELNEFSGKVHDELMDAKEVVKHAKTAVKLMEGSAKFTLTAALRTYRETRSQRSKG